MFKHVLIPTDGSATAGKAVGAGIQLAKVLGASVTGYCCIEPVQPRVFGEGYHFDSALLRSFDREVRAAAQQHIDAMARVAARAGVSFNGLVGTAETTYDGIIAAAKKQKCDVIFMASHGRRGIAGLLMGSVTQKVLSHSKIPVLVYR